MYIYRTEPGNLHIQIDTSNHVYLRVTPFKSLLNVIENLTLFSALTLDIYFLSEVFTCYCFINVKLRSVNKTNRSVEFAQNFVRIIDLIPEVKNILQDFVN